MYPRKSCKSLSPGSAISLNFKHLEQVIQKLDSAIHLALVVQKMDSAINQINHYPVDNAINFRNTYPLDSDLSGG